MLVNKVLNNQRDALAFNTIAKTQAPNVRFLAEIVDLSYWRTEQYLNSI